MPDIAMCRNASCDSRYTCFRYMAIPNPFGQSYACFEAGDCRKYWMIARGDEVHSESQMTELEQQREDA